MTQQGKKREGGLGNKDTKRILSWEQGIKIKHELQGNITNKGDVENAVRNTNSCVKSEEY